MKERLVLIADDDPLLIAMLEHKLPSAGFKVVSASDGRAALDLLKTVRPSAVVLDGAMPVLDGFEVLRRMKLDPLMRRLPVLMLTAARREQDVLGARRLGAADYLVKPFKIEDLIARLKRVVSAAEAAGLGSSSPA